MLTVIKYPASKNAYKERNSSLSLKNWVKNNKIDVVLEYHINSTTSELVNGYETLVDVNQKTYPFILNVHHEIAKLFRNDRGFKLRNGSYPALYHAKEMLKMNVPYALLELGFIRNAIDIDTFSRNHINFEKKILRLAKESGITRLGLVAGHGDGDPGAVWGKLREDELVRTIKNKEEEEMTEQQFKDLFNKCFKEKLEGTVNIPDLSAQKMQDVLEKNNISGGFSPNFDGLVTKNTLMSALAKAVKPSLYISHDQEYFDKKYWGKTLEGDINYLKEKGIISDGRVSDCVTRAELISVLAKIIKKIELK